MGERLLRSARNDNVLCAIKEHSKCHCEGLFRSNRPLFIKKNWLRPSCARNNVPNKGVYCLIVRLVRNQRIEIGKLGAFDFPAGFYVYVGSAQNNLKLRIARHLQQKKKLHWHIDYLLRHGKVIFVSPYAGAKHMECVLNRKVGGIKSATIPVMGFGSSDCLCDAHLHFFKKNPETEISGIGLTCKDY